MPSQWLTHKGRPIHPRYRIEARKYERRIIAELIRMRDEFIAANKAAKAKLPKTKTSV